MRTFYIASSSKNIPAVRRLAALLIDKGLEWKWDWTNEFDERQTEDQDLIERDLDAAVECDLFVFLDSEHHSIGAAMEYGARLASSGYVHHIGFLGS